MMLARVCRATISPQVTTLLKAPVVPNVSKVQVSRLFANDGRSTFTRTARKNPTIAERAFAPPGEGAYHIGKGFAAGAAAIALGSLCYYGAGLSPLPGVIDQMHFWPQYVKDRINTTYAYFGGSIVVSTISAALTLTSPPIMRLVSRGGFLALAASMVALIGSGMVVQSIPYQEGFGPKQFAWIVHSGLIGTVLAPLAMVGGPILFRAAVYTAGIVGGLSAIAVCAPHETFLHIGGPLAMGLGVVFASSIGSMFLPPNTAIGVGLHSIVLYGGLVLFSFFLMYDTQRIIRQAETYPVVYDKYQGSNAVRPYDPVNNAISIYLDTVNIFVRMVTILAGGGGKRK